MRKITYKILLEYGFVRRYNKDNQLIFTKNDYTIIFNKGIATLTKDNSKLNNFDSLKESYKKHTCSNLRKSYKETLTINNNN